MGLLCGATALLPDDRGAGELGVLHDMLVARKAMAMAKTARAISSIDVDTDQLRVVFFSIDLAQHHETQALTLAQSVAQRRAHPDLIGNTAHARERRGS